MFIGTLSINGRHYAAPCLFKKGLKDDKLEQVIVGDQDFKALFVSTALLGLLLFFYLLFVIRINFELRVLGQLRYFTIINSGGKLFDKKASIFFLICYEWSLGFDLLA